MRERVKTRLARKVERNTPQPVPKSLKPSTVPPPAVVDEDGLSTLEGFRPDERWMVRAYGD